MTDCRVPLPDAHHVRVDIAKSAVNWGSVPDWIAGIGSLLAFAAFSIAFIWEVRKRRHDDQLRLVADHQAAEDRRDEKARQARLIFGEHAGSFPTQARVKVHNASGAPIFNLDVNILLGPTEASVKPVQTTRRRPGPTGLAPHDEVEIWLDLVAPIPADENRRFIGIQMDFTDAHGSRWRRIDDEQPHLIE